MAGNNTRRTLARRNGHFRAGNRTKKWTIMVYLGGDNNLTPYCINVLQQLAKVQYTQEVCVLACFDSNTPWPKGSRYLALNCGRRLDTNGVHWDLHNALIPPLKRGHNFRPPDFCSSTHLPKGRQLRTGVAEGLKRFIAWSMKNHGDSERFMLILFGHGPLVAGQTFLVKENPRSSLQLDELQEVLDPHFHPGRKLDILACHNCVMNGVETAYEVKDQVGLIIGSQGLALAAGWPYDKIISEIVQTPEDSSGKIAVKLLKACARHLLDFSMMDRSSEQSICDLSQLGNRNDVAQAVKKLVRELHTGLEFQTVKGQRVLRHPVICNAVKLARLETQSYWGETFVDLYDYCERLVKRCNEATRLCNTLINQVGGNRRLQQNLRRTRLVQILRRIVRCCLVVMKKIKAMVPISYYIGSDLQYSHGLSVFFPWSMPGEPYFFVKVRNDYILKTSFETYLKYEFAKRSDWPDFLQTFYRATVRKVRRAEREFSLRNQNADLEPGLIDQKILPLTEVLTGNLQKSSSSTGFVDHEVWSNIKNYPRRNYLSPSDCPRKIDFAGRLRPGTRKEFPRRTSPPVSYLGWNIGELVAEVISEPATFSRNGRPKVVNTKSSIKGAQTARRTRASSVKRQP